VSTETKAVDRIDELKRLICAQVPILIDEARDNITEAITATMEEAQEKEEGKAVLSLAITAKWDLDGSAVVVSMPVNVRRKFTVTASMDDPQQPGLPLDPVRQEAMDAVELVKRFHADRTGGQP
jgi:hypothetical protein